LKNGIQISVQTISLTIGTTFTAQPFVFNPISALEADTIKFVIHI